MTARRVGTVVLVLAGVLVALPAAVVTTAGLEAAGPASAEAAGGDVVMPDAGADGLDFDGIVRFTWVDHGGVHTARIPVQGANGVVHVDGRGGPQGTEWPAEVGQLPALTAKYHTIKADGPVVAGRPTTVIQISSAPGSTETLALDQATGLVLARTELGAGGALVRSMQFEDVSLEVTRPPGRPTGSAARPSSRLATSRLPAEYSAPARLADGYQRLEADAVSGGVRVVYSDGVHGLSVFEQPGHLSGGRRSYQWAGGEVMTWQGGPTVFTAVGDGPSTDVVAAVRSIPQPHQLSLLGHIGSLSREVIDTLSGH